MNPVLPCTAITALRRGTWGRRHGDRGDGCLMRRRCCCSTTGYVGRGSRQQDQAGGHGGSDRRQPVRAAWGHLRDDARAWQTQGTPPCGGAQPSV